MHLVAPVDMSVDLQDPDRPVIRKAGEEGNGHGIVAAEQDRDSRQCQDLARLRLDPGPVAGIVMHGGRDVAGVDAADRLAVEQRAAEIEIPVLDERGIVLARSADGVGGQGVAAAVLAGIGAAVTGSEDHRTGHAAIGEAIGKAEKGRRGGHVFLTMGWLKISVLGARMGRLRQGNSFKVARLARLQVFGTIWPGLITTLSVSCRIQPLSGRGSQPYGPQPQEVAMNDTLATVPHCAARRAVPVGRASRRSLASLRSMIAAWRERTTFAGNSSESRRPIRI